MILKLPNLAIQFDFLGFVTLNTQECRSLDGSGRVGGLDGELALVALRHILDGQGVDVVLLHDLQVVAEEIAFPL